MPNETDGPKLTDENLDRTMSEFQDDGYLKDITEREDDMLHQEEMDRHDRFMEAVRQRREESEVAARDQTTDFQAILEAKVSKTKRIPIEHVTESWAKKEEEAQRDADQSFTTIGNARDEQFGGKKPEFHEGRVIEVVDPNQKEEPVIEVRKGTSSRHIHEPRTARSKKLRSPAQNPGVRRSSAYDKRPDK